MTSEEAEAEKNKHIPGHEGNCLRNASAGAGCTVTIAASNSASLSAAALIDGGNYGVIVIIGHVAKNPGLPAGR